MHPQSDAARTAYGFTEGATVRDKRTGERFVLRALIMRGDAVMMAHLSNADGYDRRVVPMGRIEQVRA